MNIEPNNIYNMDCIDGLKELEDETIDLVLTDPPYGIGENNDKNLSRGGVCEPTDYGDYNWDKERIGKKYFDEIFRVSKNQIIFGGNYYIDYLNPTNCMIVWDKNNGNNDFSDCELAWTSFDSAVRKYKYTWNGMIRKNNEKRYHPTQKPLGLFKKIIRDYTKEKDLICDPFLGSGTTAVGAIKTNRKYIGFEIDEKYYNTAKKRLKNVPEKLDKWFG